MKLEKLKYNGKNYTVDYRLKEFRFIELGKVPKFISFSSKLGSKLLDKKIPKLLLCIC